MPPAGPTARGVPPKQKDQKMAKTILDQEPDPATQLLTHYAEVIADFQCRMSPRDADTYLNMRANTVLGAIKRKEIRYIKNGKRYQVTPTFLAEWIENYRTVQPDPLPS